MHVDKEEELGLRALLRPGQTRELFHKRLRPAQWVGLLAGLALVLWVGYDVIVEYLRFVADQDEFSAWVLSHGLWAPFILAAFNAFQVLVAMVPGHVVAISAGYIYGMFNGTLFNTLTIVGPSILAFWLARRYGRPLAVRLAPEHIIDRWDNASDKYGFGFFLSGYLLPIFPADVMNLIAGLSTLSWPRFLFAVTVGRAPGLIFTTAAGAYGLDILQADIPAWGWALFVMVSGLVYYLWQKYYSKTIEVLPGDANSHNEEPRAQS